MFVEPKSYIIPTSISSIYISDRYIIYYYNLLYIHFELVLLTDESYKLSIIIIVKQFIDLPIVISR